MKQSPRADAMVEFVRDLQTQICKSLEKSDGAATFQESSWERPGGGGGQSKVLVNGKVFEKAGVNVSVVHGELPPLIQEKFGTTDKNFFATGLSLVIHPHSPQVPTVHCNYRYFEQSERSWFGGGADLTPYVYSEENFRHFHRTHKKVCESHGRNFDVMKKACDEYFYLPHREESRGIGGIFFDYMKDDLEKAFSFVKDCGRAFVESYVPIVERTKALPFNDRQKKFQLLRRGRYVEFNLVYDRGTLFGLQTKGNSESILMSLPPVVHFDYKADFEANEDEKNLMSCFRSPKNWV